MKKPLAIWTCGLDQTNADYAHKMLNSLRKTNPDIDKVADVFNFTQEDFVKKGGGQLEMRMLTPFFTKDLIKEYETVVRLDADMIITGDISHAWTGSADVGVVQNANPRELAIQQQAMGHFVQVWDIQPADYVNCGFVVVKSEEFANHWLSLCIPERQHYQFFEQDFLNILVFYGNYKVRFLDREENNKWHGLISKGYGSQFVLKDNKLVLPKNSGEEREPWPIDSDKEIVCIHQAGGAIAGDKFADMDIRYPKEIVDWLKQLREDEVSK